MLMRCIISFSAKQDFDTLHPDDQSLLLSLIDKDPIVKLVFLFTLL